MLARFMTPVEYGSLALVLAFLSIAVPIGPAGIDVLINRHRLELGRAILYRTLLSATLVAVPFALFGRLYYGLDLSLVILFCLGAIAGSANWIAAAYYQSRHLSAASLLLSQNTNLVLVVATTVVILSGAEVAWLAVLVIAAGYLVSAIAGWRSVVKSRGYTDTGPLPWKEGLIAVGATGADLIMMQLERLMIPTLLSIEQLATFAVLAATVGAPFRVLQLAATYAVLPRMRAAASTSQRQRAFALEGLQILGVTLIGGVVLWFVAPYLITLVVGNKYTLGQPLVLAAITAGFAKVLSAFTSAAVTAIADRRTLLVLTCASWLAVVAGIVAAWIGARWGLAGVVFGVASGWLLRAAVATFLVLSSLRAGHRARVAGSNG